MTISNPPKLYDPNMPVGYFIFGLWIMVSFSLFIVINLICLKAMIITE